VIEGRAAEGPGTGPPGEPGKEPGAEHVEGTAEPGAAGEPSAAASPVRAKVDRSIPAALTILVALASVALLYYAASIFIAIFSSVIIAIALEPLVGLLRRWARLPRHAASMIVVFLTIGALYGVLYVGYRSVQEFIADLPQISEKVRGAPLVNQFSKKFQRTAAAIEEMGRRIAPPPPPRGRTPEVVVRNGRSWTETLVKGLGSLTTVIFALSFTPFLVYFILADKESLTRRTLRLFPPEEGERVQRTLDDIERMMQRFLVGNALIAAFLAGSTIAIFGAVGLPYWALLGAASGVVSIVPYLGLVLALVPGVVAGIAVFHSAFPFVVVVGGVTILHLVAANFLIPRFVGARTHLNAVASTVALMFFGWLWGGMGLLMAIPITAVVKSVLENVDSTRALGQWLGEGDERRR
jgi:predicted PurR-regulated permease PerM